MTAQLLATPDAVGRMGVACGCWNTRFTATTISYDPNDGTSESDQTGKTEDRSKVAAKSEVVFVAVTVPVNTAVENVPGDRDVGWGGRRAGAGRPRIYLTAAARQAAYRTRKHRSEDLTTSL
jgi:hypothetical protein